MEDTVAETSNRSGGDQQTTGGDAPRSDGGLRSLPQDELYRSSVDQVAAIAGAWTAFNIALSAFFYLFDFATNLITLREYYYYSIGCYKYDYGYSRPLPHECNVTIEEGHSFPTVFYVCISLMVAAHLSNTLIFWVTLDPSEHPLRLAYFLPLIHLSRLLKVLWRTCSRNSLEDLQDRGQGESSSLYNVLAASLETAPQLMLQFHVVSQFGEEGSDYNLEEIPHPVPKTLMLSLLASLVSGTYTGSVAVLSLLQKRAGIMHRPLRWKACIVMLAVIVTWIFFAFVLRKSQHDSQRYMSRSNIHKWMIHGVHSLALAHVSLFIGPMYVIVKLFDRPTCFLEWGTLLHIIVELLGLGAVVFNKYQFMSYWLVTPCSQMDDYNGKLINVYLGCNVFIEAVCPLILLLLVSTLLFANMVAKRDTNSCEHELQLAGAQDGQQLEVLDTASNQLMETCSNVGPVECSMGRPNRSVGSSPHHIHSLITTTSCDESPHTALLPSARRPASSSFVSISFVALFIKRVVLRHNISKGASLPQAMEFIERRTGLSKDEMKGELQSLDETDQQLTNCIY